MTVINCFYDIGYLLLQVLTPRNFNLYYGLSCLLPALISGASAVNLFCDAGAGYQPYVKLRQYNVDFQYTYSSCALMIVLYMLALN